MVISEKILNDLAVDESCKTPAEEELLLKNTVFESSLAANSTSGVDGIITHANAAFMEKWGYDSLEEVVGRPIPYFFVNPDDALPILDSLNKTSKWEGNFLAKRKDGSTFIAQSLASVIRNEKGELTGYQSSVIDITERKQIENALQKSEEKYRNLTESFSELIYRADPETLVATYVNQAVERIYGYTVEEWLNDPNLWEQTIYPDDRERAFAEFTELQTKLESGIVEYRIIKKDKTIRWVQDHVSWEKDQQGKPISMNGINYDITERKKAQEAMLQAKILAEDANRTKSEFISNMSHELRTPLTSIIGFSDLLISENFGTLNESQKKYISNVLRSGKHLLELINDLLDFSKIEAGKMELILEEFAIQDAINEIKETMMPLAMKKEIELNYSINVENPIIVADSVKFKQILYNLLSNAIKFTDQGGSVTMGINTTDEIISVFVKDSGIGISPDDQDKLFNPFYQVDSSNAREYEGTGLGLALVDKFVEMHGGKIWVDSEVGKGSTFTFRIPIEGKVQ